MIPIPIIIPLHVRRIQKKKKSKKKYIKVGCAFGENKFLTSIRQCKQCNYKKKECKEFAKLYNYYVMYYVREKLVKQENNNG